MVGAFASRIFSALADIWVGECTGTQHLLTSSAIYAANHASYLDHFIIASRIFRKTGKVPCFLAKKEHFDTPVQRFWHRYLGAVPVNRQEGGREALEHAVQALKAGHTIMIYPEGTRTLTGEMSRAKTGVARLALAADVPVIPVGITNTFKILPKWKKIPRMLKADVHFGKPMRFQTYDGSEPDRKTLRSITNTIMQEIARLAKTRYPFEE